MIEYLARKSVDLVKRRGRIDETREEIYLYGADLIIYTALSTLGLLLAGVLFQHFGETVVIVAIYYTSQTIGGGFHARSHLRCFLMMLTGLIVALLGLHFPFPRWAECAIIILSAIVLYAFPLVLHQNKQYLAYKKPEFLRRSRLVTSALCVVSLGLLWFASSQYARAMALGMLVAAISRFAGRMTRSKNTMA